MFILLYITNHGVYLCNSNPVLNRCVPLKGEGLQGVLYDLYGYLNAMDVLEQVLADLYASWHLILIFVFVTLCKAKRNVSLELRTDI